MYSFCSLLLFLYSAMVRDERKLLLMDANEVGAKPKMKIFTSSGKMISEFTVNILICIT